jgi:hypothetical protein
MLMTAVPRDSTFFPPPFHHIEITDQPVGWLTLRVKRMSPVRVEVVNESGDRIDAAKVTVTAPLDPERFDLLTPLVPMTRKKSPLVGDAFVVAAGKTDRSGLVTLAAPETAFSIRAEAAGYSPVAIVDARALRGLSGVVRIELPSAAALSGRLFPAEALPANPHVLIGGANGAKVSTAPVDKSGSFSLSGVPRGRWTVMLTSRRRWGQTRVLGEVEVDSALVSCSFDVTHLAASRLQGRVRLGTEFIREGRVVFLPEGVAVPQATGISFRPSGSRESIDEYGNEAPCADGRFDIELQAGAYKARVGVPKVNRDGWHWFDYAGVLHVTPGRCALDVNVPLTTLTVEVLGVHRGIGAIAGTLIGKQFERSFSVERTHPTTISGVPAGSYAVIVRDGGLARTVPVDVAAEPATLVVDLR